LFVEPLLLPDASLNSNFVLDVSGVEELECRPQRGPERRLGVSIARKHFVTAAMMSSRDRGWSLTEDCRGVWLSSVTARHRPKTYFSSPGAAAR
jgi:hypothetical protein